MLDGKTALVTGASRGIGRAIAQRLARDGALVGVHYGSNDVAAKQVVAEIEAAGGNAFPVRAVLGEPGDAETLWREFDAALAARGVASGLDILVNNAGIVRYEHIEETTPESYDELFAINVRAPFFTVQQGLSRLRDGGRIINVSSGVTRIALPHILAYSLTKGALDTFSRTLAQQVGSRGITVNSVSPGTTDTDMNAPWLRDNPNAEAETTAVTALGRVGQPEDIADVVAFVASDDARWITGQVLDATGGMRL